MCFSAQASFVTSGILFVTGSIAIAKTNKKRQLAFASIPIIFSIQQMIEGFNWLSLQNFNPNLFGITIIYTVFFSYAYLLFAYLLWPVYIPFSLILIEKNKNIKKILYNILLLGAATTIYLFYYMINHDVTGKIINCSINYKIAATNTLDIVFASFYFISTITPFFISTIPNMKIIGVLVAFSAIITGLFYTYAFVSVWCFFAAIISILIIFFIKK